MSKHEKSQPNFTPGETEHLFSTAFRRSVVGRIPWSEADNRVKDLEFCVEWWRAGTALAFLRHSSIGKARRLDRSATYVRLNQLKGEGKLGEGTLNDVENEIGASNQSLFLSPPIIFRLARDLRLNIGSFTFVNPQTGELQYPDPKNVASLLFPILAGTEDALTDIEENPDWSIIKKDMAIENSAFKELLTWVAGKTGVGNTKYFQKYCNEAVDVIGQALELNENAWAEFPDGKTHLEEVTKQLREVPNHQTTQPTLQDPPEEAIRELWKEAAQEWQVLKWEFKSDPFYNNSNKSRVNAIRVCAAAHQAVFMWLHQTLIYLLKKEIDEDTRFNEEYKKKHDKAKSLFQINYEETEFWSDLERSLGFSIIPEWESVLRLSGFLINSEKNTPLDTLKTLRLLEKEKDGKYTSTVELERVCDAIVKVIEVCPSGDREECEKVVRRSVAKFIPHYRKNINHIEELITEVKRGLKDAGMKVECGIFDADQAEEISRQFVECFCIKGVEGMELPLLAFSRTRLFLEKGSPSVIRSEVAVPLNATSKVGENGDIRAYFFCDVSDELLPIPVSEIAEQAERKRFLSQFDRLSSQLSFLVLQPWYDAEAREAAADAEWKDISAGVMHSISNYVSAPRDYVSAALSVSKDRNAVEQMSGHLRDIGEELNDILNFAQRVMNVAKIKESERGESQSLLSILHAAREKSCHTLLTNPRLSDALYALCHGMTEEEASDAARYKIEHESRGYEALKSLCQDMNTTIEFVLPSGFVDVGVTERELVKNCITEIFVNALKNSCLARKEDRLPRVRVEVQIEKNKVGLQVLNSGPIEGSKLRVGEKQTDWPRPSRNTGGEGFGMWFTQWLLRKGEGGMSLRRLKIDENEGFDFETLITFSISQWNTNQ